MCGNRHWTGSEPIGHQYDDVEEGLDLLPLFVASDGLQINWTGNFKKMSSEAVGGYRRTCGGFERGRGVNHESLEQVDRSLA